ncbi:hypothetical protein WJX72_004559 [[Myrmecia] bisecta]|uniref:Protein kinase domain-containing protein n=1 Tax=[Myrmecia] bisecta TaxID=41462 RepID=A0AAW1Q079_9CHLO
MMAMMSEARSRARFYSRKRLSEYFGAPTPANDPDRVAHLHELHVLDTDPDPRLDEITALMGQLFEVPVALVSLVDANRQWFKAAKGQSCGFSPGTGSDRTNSFCAWTLLPVHPEVLVIEDSLADARFKDNGLVVNAPHIRFYAGAPMIASNRMRLGSLCMLDFKPRQIDAESCIMLCNLADIVVREIERADHILRAKAVAGGPSRPATRADEERPACLTHGTMLLDVTKPKWEILFASEACGDIMGVTHEELAGHPLGEVVAREAASQEESWELGASPEEIQKGAEFLVTVRPCNPAARSRALTMCFWPAYRQPLTVAPIAVPGHIPHRRSDKHGFYFATVTGAASENDGAPDLPMTDDELMAATQATMAAKVEENQVRSTNEKPELGALLRKTAHGRLCRGQTSGGPCLVKITTRMGPVDNDTPLQAVACPEADLTCTLNHPNIAALLASQMVMQKVDWLAKMRGPSKQQLLSFEGQPQTAAPGPQRLGRSMPETWIRRELCDGGSLRHAISQGVFLTERSSMKGLPAMSPLLTTMREVASAVQYMHSQGLLHCDITGDSILLHSTAEDPRGFVAKLADFDMVRCSDVPVENPLAYNSLVHLAPETVLGGRVSEESDTFAFGVLMWEAFTGEVPWVSIGDVDYIVGLTQTSVKLAWPEWTPFAYEELAAWCMARHPRNRPSLDHIMDALEELQRVADLNDPDDWNSLPLDLALHAEAKQGW